MTYIWRQSCEIIFLIHHCVRAAYILKMSNHEEESFRNSSRNSLMIDMKKRGVDVSAGAKKFLDYSVKESGFM